MNHEASEIAYLAWIADAKLPANCVRNLVLYYKTGEEVYRAVMNDDAMISQIIAPETALRLKNTRDKEYLHLIYNLILRNNIKAMTANDPQFPELLKDISDPVSILFYQGNPECLKKRIIGMVGSRRASYDGLRAAEAISCELSRKGVSIVSGFAYGIDSASHQGCVRGGSPTIAVMGCGLDQNYPADNAKLKETVLKSGGVFLTEYAPGEKPLPVNFPYRNRIISAIGASLVLIEARIRSGSLRTVDHALKQGKEVFVYPGDPRSPNYEGNHQLLRDGARYFTSADDILEDMNWLDNMSNEVQNSDCDTSVGTANPAEVTILKLLKRGDMSFEQIAAESKMLPADLLSHLTMLQILGKVESLPGKKYSLKSTS